MSEATKLLSPLSQWWRRVGPGQRIAAVVCGCICVGAVWAITAVSTRTTYNTLYTGLQEKDLGDIVAKLQEGKVPYQLAGDGTVQVPSTDVAELRLKMASAGLPKGGSVGYEIFDQNRLGGSEFQERLNFRRALQGELERTICQLTQVEQARVHIALPERALFTEQQEKPTASVTLKLRPGYTLNQGEVSSIVHLVSSSVEGLPKENVTIVDTSGTLLSSGGNDFAGGDAALASRLQLQSQVENHYQQAIQSVLDQIVGPGKAVTRVSAQLDFDQRQAQEESYKPEGDGKGVLESSRENRETYQGAGPGRTGAVGTPGVRQLAPAPATPPTTTPTTATGNPRTDGYEHVESDTRYRVSKHVETITATPGTVKRLSVAVFVDERVPLPNMVDLTKAIAASAGVQEARGDQVVVQKVPFSQPVEEASRTTLTSKLTAWYHGNGSNFLALALLGVFLLLARGLVRGQNGAATSASGQRLDLISGGPATPTLSLPAPGDTGATFNPNRATQVIRAWLATGEGA